MWGLFKKIVIADNCAVIVNDIFANYSDYSGSTLLIGAILFAFQIYGDFSGYSDIAIGTARLFGFDLMKNFAFPYFSRDIAEFWRRWHISLSTWFRDYLYIPLGGSRGSTLRQIRNVFIIFIVSGFWHGANWTFIIWGGLNALYFLPLLLLKKNRQNTDKVAAERIFPGIKEFFQITFTFCLTTIAWVFFRAESVSKALLILQEIFSTSIFAMPEVVSLKLLNLMCLLFFFIIIEWAGRNDNYAIERFLISTRSTYRWGFYYLILLVIFLFNGEQQGFIYFQF